MTRQGIIEALAKLRPGAEWALRGATLDALEWLDGKQTRPSDDEITAAIPSPLIAYAATKRWQQEVGGILYNGLTIPTNDRAKLLVLGAAMTLEDDATVPFIVGGVVYDKLSGTDFRALNAAITKHVQLSFAALASVLASIADGTIKTETDVDTVFAEAR